MSKIGRAVSHTVGAAQKKSGGMGGSRRTLPLGAALPLPAPPEVRALPPLLAACPETARPTLPALDGAALPALDGAAAAPAGSVPASTSMASALCSRHRQARGRTTSLAEAAVCIESGISAC